MSPTILIDSLHSVRRRVRLLGVLFGAGLLATLAVGLLIATVLLDFLLNLHALPRLVLTLIALGGLCYALWRWVIQSILARLSLNEVAGRIERTFPEYQDRLRSTIDILSGNAPPGSEIMKQRVVSEATRLTQSLDLSRVIVAAPVWYSATMGTGALLLLALIVNTVNPAYTHVAFDRLFSPFSNNPWPRTVSIDLVGTVPDRVSVGQRIDVNIRLTHGDRIGRKATIFYQYGDADGAHFGPVEQEYMTRDDDGIYHASVDARTPADAGAGLVKVWMESGDDSKELPPVKVVQRLTITRVQATITAPAYANLPAQHVNLSQNPALMTVGSKVELTAQFNKPLDPKQAVTVEFLSPKSVPVFSWSKPIGTTVTAAVDASESFRFHLHGIDTDGLSNTAAEEFEFVVRPDQNPTVIIENPRRNEDRTPDAVVPFAAMAEDDFGVDSLTLVIDRINDKKHWEIPLVHKAIAADGIQWNRVDPDGDMQRFRAGYSWVLAKPESFEIKPGDELEYFASVKDNFELAGKTHAQVASGKLRISIISQEEFNNKITDMLSSVAEQAAVLKQSQGATQRQTAELARETAGKPALDNADKTAAERLAGQQSTIASQTKSLATRLTDIQAQMEENKSANQELKDTARDVGNLLNSAAENPMKDAAGSINNARQAEDKDHRDQSLTDAQTSQSKAGDDLQKVLDRMGNIGSLSRSIDAVRNLLADQQKLSAQTTAAGKGNLGKTPDQLSTQDKATLEALAKAQADLGARTQKTLDEILKDADKLNKSDPAASKAMSQAADTGNQQNVPGQQAKASDATQQNQQAAAQSAQKQAELGLQMMLADLREAEKHKLDELARKLAELQQQVAILLREQAAHNLDNLFLQGNDVLTATGADVKLQLYTLSERDPRAVAAPVEPGLLSSAQEQTERNTRDIAKAAQDLADGAEPSDHLTRAADKMERAIVNLRDGKLAMAYNPAQVDALAELLDAKKLIDQQKQKAEQKQEDQKKEAVRQQYMAILAEQNEVNLKTLSIDGATRNDDGSLPREAQIRLNQLTGDQGKVSDKTAKLDETLQALGSIVYTYANRDIVKNMNEVKDSLGNAQTGAVPQALQKQVVAQLEAMIKDLATKPEESAFAQHAGGGGEGGNGKSNSGMPSEAELRLMKDLQIAENDATIAINKQQQKEKADLSSLGNRQGDLRNLLDKLLQKASKGQSKLPPEPDNRDQLPEEAVKNPGDAAEAVDNKELQDDLIGVGKQDEPGKPPARAEHDLNLVGDRMARSRQRLAMNSDPGPVTQEIQKRILDNLDDLIEEARKKERRDKTSRPSPAGIPPRQKNPARSNSRRMPTPRVKSSSPSPTPPSPKVPAAVRAVVTGSRVIPLRTSPGRRRRTGEKSPRVSARR